MNQMIKINDDKFENFFFKIKNETVPRKKANQNIYYIILYLYSQYLLQNKIVKLLCFKIQKQKGNNK